MAFVVVTAGTVFYQNSNSPTARPPAASRPVPLPPVSSVPTFAPAGFAETAEEFRKASEPFTQPGRVVDPAKVAVMRSGQENLGAARAELAKGNKQKAEEYLKLVRIATEQLQKN